MTDIDPASICEFIKGSDLAKSRRPFDMGRCDR